MAGEFGIEGKGWLYGQDDMTREICNPGNCRTFVSNITLHNSFPNLSGMSPLSIARTSLSCSIYRSHAQSVNVQTNLCEKRRKVINSKPSVYIITTSGVRSKNVVLLFFCPMNSRGNLLMPLTPYPLASYPGLDCIEHIE